MQVKFSLVFSCFLILFFSGCTFYAFDPQYYKAKKYAKQYSGIYVFNQQAYHEILESIKDSKKYDDEKLEFQRQLFKQIRANTNQEWLKNKEKYQELTRKLSGYTNEKNAQTLFVLAKIDEKFSPTNFLSNGKKYHHILYVSDYDIKIPESLMKKIHGETMQDSKFQRIIYPQYFSVSENAEIEIISIGVVYLYKNINKVYSLKEDSLIDMEFASGEWKYLVGKKVFIIK
ncbi:hypothetical protein CQA53_04495 [Helicobacter didelphidarum]|uniref:Uncharacterized protein n=1 Tax=Helicobacter didelphidarum TaxID=2040648 RepID=A0A3D8ILI4_9HELI|nr:hypothetical protein [Helicobacter didelphidarum]RDU66069.1 hypothetical protein CQA53_04495 [Helicobacter didelphidarum]